MSSQDAKKSVGLVSDEGRLHITALYVPAVTFGYRITAFTDLSIAPSGTCVPRLETSSTHVTIVVSVVVSAAVMSIFVSVWLMVGLRSLLKNRLLPPRLLLARYPRLANIIPVYAWSF